MVDIHDRHLKKSYQSVLKLVSEILYRADPMGMGSVGAPLDEYDPVANQMVRAFFRLDTAEEVRAFIESRLEAPDDGLVAELVALWTSCVRRPAVERRPARGL